MMHIAIGSDKQTELTSNVIKYLKSIGHTLDLHGALVDPRIQWVQAAYEVATKVHHHRCQQGILFCCTGTGVSIVANKIRGIRAALCTNAATASGARKWNDANILVMRLHQTSIFTAKEILTAWFETKFECSEAEQIKQITAIEESTYGGQNK